MLVRGVLCVVGRREILDSRRICGTLLHTCVCFPRTSGEPQSGLRIVVYEQDSLSMHTVIIAGNELTMIMGVVGRDGANL